MVQARIESKMIRAVNQYFRFDKIKQPAINFITYKVTEGFPAGGLTLFHYRMFGGESEEIYQVAAAIELMMLALDILDDVQDQDNFTVPWMQMDAKLSLNIGTAMLVLSTRLIQDTSFELNRKSKATTLLHDYILKAGNGQYLDLLNQMTSEEECLEIIGLKSGSLIAAACVIGTVFAVDGYEQGIAKYATHFGMAAQIKNDIEDIKQWRDGSDLICKKVTLPILFMLHSELPDFQIIRDYYLGKVGQGVILATKEHLDLTFQTSGVFEYCEVMIRIQQLHAIEAIQLLNISEEWRGKLIDYLQNRN